MTSFSELDHLFRQALELAWDSARAGSLGIGAVFTRHDGSVVTTGATDCSNVIRVKTYSPEPRWLTPR